MSLTLANRFALKRFFRGEPAKNLNLLLNHRRIFILPNKAGLALAVVILLMLIASINYSNSMGFVFTFLLASAAQVSTLFSFRNLSGLSISSMKCEPCFLGQTSAALFTIEETQGRERWAITAKIDQCIVHIPHIKPYSHYQLSVPIVPKERGLSALNTLTLSSSFPFDIFRAWSPLRFNRQILTYPKPKSFNQPLSIGQFLHNGDALSSTQMGTDDFIGFSPYQHGHPLHLINWHALAKEKGLMVSQFSTQQQAETWVDWFNCSATNTESKLSELCQWVLDANTLSINYGLRLPQLDIKPSHGILHQQTCLKALAVFKQSHANR
ncbi:MAG: DUF58 domain-containing protein [Cycloclasticus sp.]|nr:DUF58 domain-containing protein [Cycloclasticus sp.]